VKLVHLVGFITKKFVTMHGHMNVKCYLNFFIKTQLSSDVPRLFYTDFFICHTRVTEVKNQAVLSIFENPHVCDFAPDNKFA